MQLLLLEMYQPMRHCAVRIVFKGLGSGGYKNGEVNKWMFLEDNRLKSFILGSWRIVHLFPPFYDSVHFVTAVTY